MTWANGHNTAIVIMDSEKQKQRAHKASGKLG